MNILFVAQWNADAPGGVEKKLQGEVAAFEQLGQQVAYIVRMTNAFFLIHKGEKQLLLQVGKSRLQQYFALETAVLKALQISKLSFDVCYIRKNPCSPYHLYVLKRLRKYGVRIAEEIPTYPYDAELRSLPGLEFRLAYFSDRLTRRFLKYWVDFFVPCTEIYSIWGVPAIPIINGVDTSQPSRVQPAPYQKTKLNLLALASMANWHGYDRLLRGLAIYKDSPEANACEVIVHMVGDGAMKQEWENLCEELNLMDSVAFYSRLTGEALDQVCRQCHLLVGSLGLYRSGFHQISTLKVKESMYMGMPFVYACPEIGLDEPLAFALKVPNDDSAINILDVLSFYHKVGNDTILRKEMRNLVETKFSYVSQMRKVVLAWENI